MENLDLEIAREEVVKRRGPDAVGNDLVTGLTLLLHRSYGSDWDVTCGELDRLMAECHSKDPGAIPAP